MADWRTHADTVLTAAFARADKAYERQRRLPVRDPLWLSNGPCGIHLTNKHGDKITRSLASLACRGSHYQVSKNIAANAKHPKDAAAALDWLERFTAWCEARLEGHQRHMATVEREQARHVQRLVRAGSVEMIRGVE